MALSTQQIQTVVRTYNKQLRLAGFNRTKRCDPPPTRKDEVTISAEGKRQQIDQRSTNPLVEKTTYNIAFPEGADGNP
jgi:hypothetical protein